MGFDTIEINLVIFLDYMYLLFKEQPHLEKHLSAQLKNMTMQRCYDYLTSSMKHKDLENFQQTTEFLGEETLVSEMLGIMERTSQEVTMIVSNNVSMIVN